MMPSLTKVLKIFVATKAHLAIPAKGNVPNSLQSFTRKKIFSILFLLLKVISFCFLFKVSILLISPSNNLEFKKLFQLDQILFYHEAQGWCLLFLLDN